MSKIALFHSVLGVRPGVVAAAELLRSEGHDIEIVDQYDGLVFDDYERASAYAADVGHPVLLERAVGAVEHLADGFIAAGFSNGGGMSEFVATRRHVAGVAMLSGVLSLEMLGASAKSVECWTACVVPTSTRLRPVRLIFGSSHSTSMSTSCYGIVQSGTK